MIGLLFGSDFYLSFSLFYRESKRASVFLLDLPLFCQANKFIHSYYHSILDPSPISYETGQRIQHLKICWNERTQQYPFPRA